jgi:hypothetical protein
VVALGEEEFEQELAGLYRLVRLGVHNHAIAHLKGTRRLQGTLFLYFHQTDAARTDRLKGRMVAQGRDVYPGSFGCLENGLA